MKRTFTKLMTAIALLLFITPPLVGWGQSGSLFLSKTHDYYNRV